MTTRRRSPCAVKLEKALALNAALTAQTQVALDANQDLTKRLAETERRLQVAESRFDRAFQALVGDDSEDPVGDELQTLREANQELRGRAKELEEELAHVTVARDQFAEENAKLTERVEDLEDALDPESLATLTHEIFRPHLPPIEDVPFGLCSASHRTELLTALALVLPEAG